MITKEQADQCTNHHDACDCQQYKKERTEQALEKIYGWANFALRHEIPFSFTKIQKIKDVAIQGLEGEL